MQPVQNPKEAETFTLITGGTSGIGLELARQAAADGRNLILVAHNADGLEAAAGEFRRRVQVHTIAEDLSQPGAAGGVLEGGGPLGVEGDCLINDAGSADPGAFWRAALAKQARMIGANIPARTVLTRLFLPPMLERRHGRI